MPPAEAPQEPSRPSPFETSWAEGEDVVAAGGTLAPELVLDAYRHGVFPFFDASQPVLWWCPDPRAVLEPDALHVSRRLERTLRRPGWEIRVNESFEEVMRACDEGRPDGTWIHEGMVTCYTALHTQGHAHSVEVRRDGHLVGGIYGIAAGGLFAAESKFHRVRDASKVALVHLVRRLAERGFGLLDVQFLTPHLARFGCKEIPRDDYLERVRTLVEKDVSFA